jgi:dienelactone hydrolase
VHSGFYESVSNLAFFFITDIIIRWVKSNKKKKIVITGYSKGAAMAPLAAVLLRNKNVPVDEVHLYEPPRCGDVNFALAYNLAFPNTTRYEYQDDLVPHTPPTPIEMAILDSSSAIKGILHTLYPDADSWNYLPVGTLQFVNWDQPDPAIVSDSDDLEKQRLQHLADDFAQSSQAPTQDHALNGHLFDVLMKKFSCDCAYPTWVDGPTSRRAIRFMVSG